MAPREKPVVIPPVTKKNVGEGTILNLRETAVVACCMGKNRGYWDEESECGHSHKYQCQSQIPASHASEGSLTGCKVLLTRTAQRFWWG